jgi:type II secretory pathway predicted ATPase ExeA
MYQGHWGLSEMPFPSCHDPRHFYQGTTHEEALARLHFLVEQHRRLGLLTGGPGSGKSLLLEVFARQIRRHGGPVAKVATLGLDGAELLGQIAGQLGLNPGGDESIASLWRALGDRLLEFRYQQSDTVLLLDDVDQADRQVLAQITRLAQWDRSAETRFTLVLSGQPQGMSRIGRTLLEMAELRIDVEPWEPADTSGYVQTSLRQAGGAAEAFTDAALQRLHELAQGVPRRVAQLADFSLLAGAGRNLSQIDAEVVESVYHELGVVPV